MTVRLKIPEMIQDKLGFFFPHDQEQMQKLGLKVHWARVITSAPDQVLLTTIHGGTWLTFELLGNNEPRKLQTVDLINPLNGIIAFTTDGELVGDINWVRSKRPKRRKEA